ncbi:Mov34/MPN/PAD-1 family protein [Fodinicurvata halophila]
MCSAGICGVISYRIGDTGRELVITEAVLDHVGRHRQYKPSPSEAGGQLFARFEGLKISVERATGPRPSDRRSLFVFSPNRLAERSEIVHLFKVGLHYVGDWHTHPEPHPQPSATDISSFQDMFQQSRHRLASFVMIIVGKSEPPDGLFVALCNNEGVKRLRTWT